MTHYRNIVVLTGAGVSAESGLKTFRDSDGLWENHRIADVCTPEAFERNPELVQRFYNARRQQLRASAKPNAAHLALAHFEQRHKGSFLLITQNIDNLHEQAGSRQLLHMHGELLKARCTGCSQTCDWQGDLTDRSQCPNCAHAGRLRPDIVWFGEAPLHMATIDAALARCELFVAIGTSGNVYPAAGFVQTAASVGADTVLLNLDAHPLSGYFSDIRQGPATQLVPEFLGSLI